MKLLLLTATLFLVALLAFAGGSVAAADSRGELTTADRTAQVGTATQIYWIDASTGTIRRANLDGSGAIEDLITSGQPTSLAVDLAAGKLYWTDTAAGKIKWADLNDFSSQHDFYSSETGRPTNLALDAVNGDLYWTDQVPGSIQRANTDGSISKPAILVLQGLPTSLALDPASGYMYWTDGATGKIRRANAKMGQPIRSPTYDDIDDLATDLIWPDNLALDLAQREMYWTEWAPGRIRRANLHGAENSSIENLVRFTSGLPTGLVLHLPGGKMYWTDGVSHRIQSADLTGTDFAITLDGLNAPKGIVVAPGLTALQSAPQLYWVDNDEDVPKIQRTNRDDIRTVEDLNLITEDQKLVALKTPFSIALDPLAAKMYWTDIGGAGKIQRANLDGTGVENLKGGLADPVGIALDLDNGWLYWADKVNQGIYRSKEDINQDNLQISANKDFSISAYQPYQIALDTFNGHMYWTEQGGSKIRRADLDGNIDNSFNFDPEEIAPQNPFGLAIDLVAGRMYWTERSSDEDSVGDSIRSTDLDGQNGQILVHSAPQSLSGIAVDVNDGKIYWTDKKAGAILRTDPTDPNQAVEPVVTGLSSPEGVVVARPFLDSERLALTALYRFTDGDNWEKNDGWLSDAAIGDWHGVTTNNDGRVTALRLSNNNLVGPVPANLVNLTDLETLILANNYLTGSIPAGLGSLPNLETLTLRGNHLEGAIPDLSALSDTLRWLNLEYNEFDGEIPTWLGDFIELRGLGLGHNRLRGTIPAELGELANLRVLYLDDQDYFRGREHEAYTPDGDKIFESDWSYLHGGIPGELGNLRNLEVLDLSDNRLGGLIPRLLGFGGFYDDEYYNLRVLDLSGNDLSGGIPLELGGFAKLTILNLSQNDLSGEIPLALQRLTNLRGLHLNDNELDGPIPSELEYLIVLKTLDLSDNQFTSMIPSSLGNLRFLEVLDFQGNSLTGAIPPELGELSRLETLNLSRNNLQHKTPTTLSKLANLEMLDLSRNENLTVDVSQLGHIRLVHLYLAGSATDKCLPKEWRAVPYNDLDQVALGDCADVSEIEQEQKALILLYNATDGDNWIQKGQWTNIDQYPYWPGVVVDEQGYVTELNLQNRNLVGVLPPALGDLTKLQTLRLERNSLSGCVPQVGNLISALDNGRVKWQVELQDYVLGAGHDPPLWESMWAGFSFAAAEYFGGEEGASLHIHGLNPTFNSSPTFSVGIPPCAPWPEKLDSTVPRSSQDADSDRDALLSLCENYSNVDGGYCPWKGWDNKAPLRDWHGVKTENGRVIHLELTRKGLQGEIPHQLGNLGALRYLNLSNNQLSGMIPPQLGNLTNLHTLALNHNKLEGSIPAELGHLGEERSEWFMDLFLQENHLTGRIPAELANIGYLRTIKVDPQRDISNPDTTYELPGCLPASAVLDTISIGVNFLPKFLKRNVDKLSKLSKSAQKNFVVDEMLKTERGRKAIDNLGEDKALEVLGEQYDAATEAAEKFNEELKKAKEDGTFEDIRGFAGNIVRGTVNVILTTLSFGLDVVGSAFAEVEKRWADLFGTGDRDDVRCTP